MARGQSGDASFSRRSPRLKRGPGRPGVPFIPIEGGGETTDHGRVALFAVFRDGRRVYLPPRSAPGVQREEAERLARQLGDEAEVIRIYDPEDAA